MCNFFILENHFFRGPAHSVASYFSSNTIFESSPPCTLCIKLYTPSLAYWSNFFFLLYKLDFLLVCSSFLVILIWPPQGREWQLFLLFSLSSVPANTHRTPHPCFALLFLDYCSRFPCDLIYFSRSVLCHDVVVTTLSHLAYQTVRTFLYVKSFSFLVCSQSRSAILALTEDVRWLGILTFSLLPNPNFCLSFCSYSFFPLQRV